MAAGDAGVVNDPGAIVVADKVVCDLCDSVEAEDKSLDIGELIGVREKRFEVDRTSSPVSGGVMLMGS